MLWNALQEELQPRKPLSAENTSKSIRTRNGDQNKQSAQLVTDFGTWGFGKDDFSAGSQQMPRPSEGTNSRVFGEAKALESNTTSEPAGWAVF